MDFETSFTRDGFWCFEQRGVRCFLLEGETDAVLIDTGFGGDLLSLCREKTDKPIKLLLTHGDKDHTGGLAAFGSFRMHPEELENFKAKNGEPADWVPIREGECLDLGRFCLEAIHIPGHTPGSVALLERKKGFLIGGDSIQIGPIYMFGPGRDMVRYRESMEKLHRMRAAFNRVYSSHNQLLVPGAMTDELRDFADEILAGRLPAAEPAPAHLPASVGLYRRGRAAFYLNGADYDRKGD